MRQEYATGRYGRVAIGFHWAIALLILVNWPLGFFSEDIQELTGTSPVPVHKSIGLTILTLSVLRLMWRLRHPPPALPPSIRRSRALAARITHACFYVLMIAVPLTGWLRTSAGRYPLTWFGLLDVPKFPISPGSAQARIAADGHELLAWAMLVLLSLHVGAALHHHLPAQGRGAPAHAASSAHSHPDRSLAGRFARLAAGCGANIARWRSGVPLTR